MAKRSLSKSFTEKALTDGTRRVNHATRKGIDPVEILTLTGFFNRVMRKLTTTIALLLSLYITGQEHKVYVVPSFDPNKAFGVVDNPRTEIDNRGLDWDIELGVSPRNLGLFLYYGEFAAMDYKNYGVGIEWFPVRQDMYEWSIGGSAGSILKKVNDSWANFVTGNLRTTFVYWAFEGVGISFRGQYQGRPDLKVTGIFETSIGLKIKIIN